MANSFTTVFIKAQQSVGGLKANLGVAALLLSSTAIATSATTHKLPAVDSCVEVGLNNPSSPNWPHPVYLCHHSAAAFNALKALPAYDPKWSPEKSDMQGLANMWLDSRFPSLALAQSQRWYSQLANAVEATTSVVHAVDLLSPYYGCKIEVTVNGFHDPCLGAEWDRLGRLTNPIEDLPDQALRQFPFVVGDGHVVLGQADDKLQWTLQSFLPDLMDTSQPLLERVGLGLFWGMVDEVAAVWPRLIAQGELTETDQSYLFIMAVSKQQAASVRFLVAQGVDPRARNESGDDALSFAELIESETMQQLLTELTTR